MLTWCNFQETILDASEDDQLQAAIRASLVENRNAPASDNESGSDEDDDEPGDWFDSESDSRASEPRKAEDTGRIEPEPQPVGNRLEATQTDDDWERHLGPETDPISSIVFRFPDGSKEQKALPCSSTLLVRGQAATTNFLLFVFRNRSDKRSRMMCPKQASHNTWSEPILLRRTVVAIETNQPTESDLSISIL